MTIAPFVREHVSHPDGVHDPPYQDQICEERDCLLLEGHRVIMDAQRVHKRCEVHGGERGVGQGRVRFRRKGRQRGAKVCWARLLLVRADDEQGGREGMLLPIRFILRPQVARVLALPAVSTKELSRIAIGMSPPDGNVFLHVRAWPMGFTWSLFAQATNLHVAEKSSPLTLERCISDHRPPPPGVLSLHYVCIGRNNIRKALTAGRDLLERAALATHEVEVGREAMDMLEGFISGEGVVQVSDQYYWRLKDELDWLLGAVAYQDVGLVATGSLSCCHIAHRFMRKFLDREVEMWPSPRMEIAVFRGLLPLLRPLGVEV